MADVGGGIDFLVRRDDIREHRVADVEPPEPGPGEALLSVDAFGLTANNITYAHYGEAMSYWNFFPAEDGWGKVPAWGFATVTASAHDDIAEGTRVYGYVPMSTHLLVAPSRVDERGFMDGAPHRAELPAPYNHYRRVDADPYYDPNHEDAQILLWPLFITSYLLDDFLADNRFFGATTAIVSGASSKTAIGTAFQLATRDDVESVALTSPGNREFVEGLEIYDRVATYEEVDSLPDGPALYVDVAGNVDARRAVHERYGDSLAHSCAVGDAHRGGLGSGGAKLPGPAPQLFFAPYQAQKRTQDWGADELERRVAEAWRDFVAWSGEWLQPERAQGAEALTAAYTEVLDGETSPTVGHVLSLQPEARPDNAA